MTEEQIRALTNFVVFIIWPFIVLGVVLVAALFIVMLVFVWPATLFGLRPLDHVKVERVG